MERFGIDWLSLSFPAARPSDPGAWDVQSHVKGDGGTLCLHLESTIRLLEANIRVRWSEQRGRGRLVFNPSRIHDPDGYTIAPVDRVLDITDEVARMANDVLTLPRPTDVGLISVARIDFARDFLDVSDIGWSLRHLHPRRPRYDKKNGLFSDPGRGGAQTLLRGSKTGGTVRLYDLEAAHPGRGVPKGSLRAEIQMNRGWRKRAAVSQLCDALARAPEVAEERWVWSLMGEPVVIGATPQERVVAALRKGDMSVAKGATLLGRRLLRSEGVTDLGAQGTELKYRRLEQQLGIASDEALDDRHLAVHLDWATGREVRMPLL